MKLNWKRKFFYLIYSAIGRFLPRTYMPYSFGSKYIRNFLVRGFVNSCGNNVKIQTGVLLSPNVEIGDNVEINENVRVRSGVKIGSDVLLAPGVQLISVNHEFSDIQRPIKEQGEKQGYIEIGDDVWIGTNVIVLPNVCIGKGSIIGAGSIVTKSIKNYSIAAGNPAKIIRERK